MGTNYANEDGEWRSELMCSSNIGDELRVVPEPDNEYDPNAIALYNDKGKIGYLPASYAEQGESCLRRGGLVRAVVKDIEVGERRSRDDKMYIVLRYYSPK